MDIVSFSFSSSHRSKKAFLTRGNLSGSSIEADTSIKNTRLDGLAVVSMFFACKPICISLVSGFHGQDDISVVTENGSSSFGCG